MSIDIFYHATSRESATGIKNNGFRLSSNNYPRMFGQGHYFTRKPVDAILKVDSNQKCEAIIEVKINLGKLRTERYAHPEWDSRYARENGFDSVQMEHCKTGVEICVYETNRISINEVYYLKERKDSSEKLAMIYQSDSHKILTVQMPNCTYAKSGDNYSRQLWFACKTCQLDPIHGGKGCCTICAKYCHAGHDVVCIGVHPECFCDCGAEYKSNRRCKCIH